MSQAVIDRSIRRVSAVELAHQLHVPAKTVEHIQKSLGLIMQFAMSVGVPGLALATLTGDEIRQAIEDPIAQAYATPEEGLAMLLNEEGGCVSVEEAAALYRKPDPVRTAAITEKIRSGTMIAYKTGAAQYRVPRWQFKPEGGVLPGLADVLQILRTAKASYNQLTPFAFFLQAHPLTGEQTPLEVLRSGDVNTVAQAARSEAE